MHLELLKLTYVRSAFKISEKEKKKRLRFKSFCRFQKFVLHRKSTETAESWIYYQSENHAKIIVNTMRKYNVKWTFDLTERSKFRRIPRYKWFPRNIPGNYFKTSKIDDLIKPKYFWGI